jgi:hypothetical protein
MDYKGIRTSWKCCQQEIKRDTVRTYRNTIGVLAESDFEISADSFETETNSG